VLNESSARISTSPGRAVITRAISEPGGGAVIAPTGAAVLTSLRSEDPRPARVADVGQVDGGEDRREASAAPVDGGDDTAGDTDGPDELPTDVDDGGTSLLPVTASEAAEARSTRAPGRPRLVASSTVESPDDADPGTTPGGPDRTGDTGSGSEDGDPSGGDTDGGDHGTGTADGRAGSGTGDTGGGA
jgi:hypothetical protein